MEYKKMSIQEKTKRIVDEIQQEKGCNPVRIFKSMAQKEYISIHGPEHHILNRIAYIGLGALFCIKHMKKECDKHILI